MTWRFKVLRLCPFCRTLTYYDTEVTERAAKDGMVRVNCEFCLLKFWPGTQEDIEQHKQA